MAAEWQLEHESLLPTWAVLDRMDSVAVAIIMTTRTTLNFTQSAPSIQCYCKQQCGMPLLSDVCSTFEKVCYLVIALELSGAIGSAVPLCYRDSNVTTLSVCHFLYVM